MSDNSIHIGLVIAIFIFFILFILKNKKAKISKYNSIRVFDDEQVSNLTTLKKSKKRIDSDRKRLRKNERQAKKRNRIKIRKALKNESKILFNIRESVDRERCRIMSDGFLRDLLNVDPYEFERIVGLLFEVEGYHVKETAKSGDGGIDLIIKKNSILKVVQVKRYANTKVGSPDVRDLWGAKNSVVDWYGNKVIPNGAIIVTTSYLTGDANKFVLRNIDSFEVIEKEKLIQWFLRNPNIASKVPNFSNLITSK